MKIQEIVEEIQEKVVRFDDTSGDNGEGHQRKMTMEGIQKMEGEEDNGGESDSDSEENPSK